MSHGMHTCFKAIYYSLTLQERVIQTSLERATYSHLHMKKSETTFSSPVWQWDNVNWTIQWDSKYSSTYHLESVLSSSGDCGSRVSMFENISDPPDDSTPLFPTTNRYIEKIFVCQVLAYDTVSFCSLGLHPQWNLCKTLHTINFPASRFTSQWTYMPEDERPGVRKLSLHKRKGEEGGWNVYKHAATTEYSKFMSTVT